MVYRKISQDIKERAMYLLENDYCPEEVREFLGISQSSIERWHENLETYGSVIRPQNPNHGRPWILTADQKREVLGLVDEAPDLYLDEICDWLAVAHGVVLSKTAVHRLISDAGITFKVMRKAAAERDEEQRALWRRTVQVHLLANMVVTVDESSKDGRTLCRRYGRAPHGHRAQIVEPFSRGDRYSIVAAMSTEGYISCRVVEGSVNGLEFFDFIVEEVLPRMNPYPQNQSVLILDNCSIHKTEVLRELVEAQGCQLVFLPPYSPDMNPIEESFSALKAWLRRHYRRLQDSEDPIMDIFEGCLTITAEKAKAWFANSGYRT